jgi:hypothetical protein
MRLRSRLIPLIFLAVLTLTASVGNADMWCSKGGYIMWLDHLPYCVASSMSQECMYCAVTGETFTLGEW